MLLRLTLLVIGLASSYIGSMCFQGGSGSDMAVGGGAILIGILSFFFLGKGLWRFLGCMTTFVLMAIIVGVLLFFISGSDILGSLTAKFTNKQQQTAPAVSQQIPATAAPAQEPTEPNAMPAPTQAPTPVAAPVAVPSVAPQQQASAPVTEADLVGLPPSSGPEPLPIPQVVTGRIESIVSGDVFRVGPHKIRLYGIASPLIDQNCLDQSGRSYECGYVAARMLRDFVNKDEVSCQIMNINAQQELMAACSVGTFDIGAALVEEGWAIALPAVTQIYIPYQAKAQQAKRGLWAGHFQMPWEWQVEREQIQKQKSKIKVPKISTKKKSSIFDAF